MQYCTLNDGPPTLGGKRQHEHLHFYIQICTEAGAAQRCTVGIPVLYRIRNAVQYCTGNTNSIVTESVGTLARPRSRQKGCF